MLAVNLAIVGGFLILLVGRIRSVKIFLLLAFLLTFGSRMMIGSMDFYPLRLLVFFGLLRVVLRGEYRDGFNRLDKSILVWAFCMVSIYTLQRGEVSALINRLGSVLNFVGPYFFFRYNIKSMDEVR
jgi:hypothetical protein